jgi:hypothetical protein
LDAIAEEKVNNGWVTVPTISGKNDVIPGEERLIKGVLGGA